MELDTDGKSRKPEKKRIKKVKPNMDEMVKMLRGFNGMVLQREREREREREEGESMNLMYV